MFEFEIGLIVYDGKRVKSLRSLLGITQVDLAVLLGIHPMTISRWERGLLAPTDYQGKLLRTFEQAAENYPGVGAMLPKGDVTGSLHLLFQFAYRPKYSIDCEFSISDLRTALGLTQLELAYLLDVHETDVRCWERGAPVLLHQYQFLRAFKRAVDRVPDIGSQLDRATAVELVTYQLLHAARSNEKKNA